MTLHSKNPPGCLIHRNPAMVTFAIFDTKLIIGFDFATTRYSSPGFPSCCLFDVILRFLIDLRWLQEQKEKVIVLNKRRKWFHSSRVKLPLVSKSLRWFPRVNILKFLILGSKLILSNNRSGATLWVRDNASHRRTSACNNHLDHCLILFKNKAKHRSGRVVRL